jgi:hypothetical protein
MLWVRLPLRASCTTLCDKVCQWLATGLWVSLCPPVSSTNKTYRHDIAEILLKVALNTIRPTNQQLLFVSMSSGNFSIKFLILWNNLFLRSVCGPLYMHHVLWFYCRYWKIKIFFKGNFIAIYLYESRSFYERYL